MITKRCWPEYPLKAKNAPCSELLEGDDTKIYVRLNKDQIISLDSWYVSAIKDNMMVRILSKDEAIRLSNEVEF